jgi:hypothetical protein
VIVGTGVAASETTWLTVFEHVVAETVSVTVIVKLPPARAPARTVADAVLTPAVIVPLPVIVQLYVLFGALLAVENVATALSHIVVGPLITGVGVARTLTVIVLRATQPEGVVSVSVTVAEFVGVEPQVTVIVFWFRAVTVDGLATVPAPVAPPGVVIVPPTTSHLYVSPV